MKFSRSGLLKFDQQITYEATLRIESNCHGLILRTRLGPSIYDVHTEGGGGSGSGGRMWTGGGGPAPCGRPHRKLKLESTDDILSSSHAKKLASFFNQNFIFGQEKSGNLSAI